MTRIFAAALLLALALATALASDDPAADLFSGVAADNADSITAALDSGADIDYIGPNGQTALMHAVLMGKAAAVKVLLERGADTSIGEKDGYTPMHGAGFQGRAKIAELLIAHGLDPSDRHPDGYTPLHRACWGTSKRHTATVRVLLKAGVPFDQPASSGKKCLEMASQNAKTVKLITQWAEKAANPESPDSPEEKAEL